jgi:hypothetical protein
MGLDRRRWLRRDLPTANPASRCLAMRNAAEIAPEIGIVIIEEIAPQLAVDCRRMPPELGRDPPNRLPGVTHPHDRIAFGNAEMAVVSWHCASFRVGHMMPGNPRDSHFQLESARLHLVFLPFRKDTISAK